MSKPQSSIFKRIMFFVTAACLIGLAVQGVRVVRDTVTGVCGYEITQIYPSPDGQRIVLVSIGNCGATTPYVTAVRIVKTGEGFVSNQPPLPSSTSTSSQQDFFSIRNRHKLKVTWKNPHTVEVLIPRFNHVYVQEKTVDGVRVIYR